MTMHPLNSTGLPALQLITLLLFSVVSPVEAHAEQRAAPCTDAVVTKLRQQQAMLETLQRQLLPDRHAKGVSVTRPAPKQASLGLQYEQALSKLLSPETLSCLPNIVKLDVQTKRLLRGGAQLTPVLTASDWLIVLSRTPSQTLRPEGYCGAGSEDQLILLHYAAGQLALLDDFLLQSCLKSITLESEHGDDVKAALAIDREQHTLAFQWLGIPDALRHKLTVSQRKFKLDPPR
jgi:hypothetical protein